MPLVTQGHHHLTYTPMIESGHCWIERERETKLTPCAQRREWVDVEDADGNMEGTMDRRLLSKGLQWWVLTRDDNVCQSTCSLGSALGLTKAGAIHQWDVQGQAICSDASIGKRTTEKREECINVLEACEHRQQ